MELKDITWKRVNHGSINEPLIDYLEKMIDEQHELGNKLNICVGTDSQKRGKGFKYAVAIIVEMKKPMGKVNNETIYKGLGAKVISGVFQEKYRPTIRERMLKEVQLSINVCFHILDLVELYDIDLEIHADVNPNPLWASNVAFSEVVGFCKGMQLTYRVKPNAYAASSGADKLCNSGS
jgi:predicted RNase H-related nuclease YkuK (DUF458 family)